jgi:putative membrane protein
MIIREKTGPYELLFAMQGSVLPRVLLRILTVSLLALLIVWVDAAVIALPHTNVAPFAVFGVALSLFLGFRNNAAYDRWWEGRRLWGQLVADMRALARDCAIFLPDETARHEILRLALAFLHLHRVNLRKIAQSSTAKDWSGQDFSAAPHPPAPRLMRPVTRPPSPRPMALPARPWLSGLPPSPWHRRAANA